MESKEPRIIILHGLNNTLEAFHPLSQIFRAHYEDVKLLILPGHGEKRNEYENFQQALGIFDQRMRELTQAPYVVVAFSLGALYLQHWLQHPQTPKPLCQVLLAPALFPKNLEALSLLFKVLPKSFFIPSQTPKGLRRYSKLYAWEYQSLLEGIKLFQSEKMNISTRTLVILDPQDELVSMRRTVENLADHAEIRIIPREYLKGKKPGKYHILFHPHYFDQKDWENLQIEILKFIQD